MIFLYDEWQAYLAVCELLKDQPDEVENQLVSILCLFPT